MVKKFLQQLKKRTNISLRASRKQENSSSISPNAKKNFLLRHGVMWFFLLTPILLATTEVLARKMSTSEINFSKTVAGNPILLMVVLGAMSLLPFVLIMITSFVKIAVVLSIIRSALGTQQNPPTQVITGLAIILTVYIMVPVGLEIRDETDQLLTKQLGRGSNLISRASVKNLIQAALKAREPIRRFLQKHSHFKDRNMFYSLALQLRKPKDRKGLTSRDLTILIPAFVISELKEAFQIGFLIFLPFIIVDMVVANILLALGMHMLSPTTISLPFKLLLFVLVDGWYLITKGLILGYI